jgi:hypothetical protein
MFYLAEQVFVCLLQTYRPGVLGESSTTEYLNHVQAARWFRDLASTVFSLTG